MLQDVLTYQTPSVQGTISMYRILLRRNLSLQTDKISWAFSSDLLFTNSIGMICIVLKFFQCENYDDLFSVRKV